MVNTSPCLIVAEPVPPSMAMVDAPCVLIAPLTRIVSDVEREPVVWFTMDCDMAISL